MLEHDPRETVLIALAVGLAIALIVTLAVVLTADRTSVATRINHACLDHRGVQQDLNGANTVICKDGVAVDY